MPEPILLSWSGGKDSNMTLYALQQSDAHFVIALLTTVTEEYDRISMHGVRRELLEQQARAVDIPSHPIFISSNSSNDDYERKMDSVLRLYQEQGVTSVAFGDIFLEDLRRYREHNLKKIGMGALFPIWQRDTVAMAREFIDLGFKAVVTCVDTEALDASFAGRIIDETFLADLPDEVDPCGENGEFHSFVFDGPTLKGAIPVTIGERVLRDERFCFCDVLPDEA